MNSHNCALCRAPLPVVDGQPEGHGVSPVARRGQSCFACFTGKVLPQRFKEVPGGPIKSERTTRAPSPLGAGLRYLRRRDELSQRDLAGIIGCSHSSLSKWESGERSPQGDNLRRLLKLLPMVPTEELL